ncbi:MAG: DNA methyltransferase [Actinobacteria bacterium]|nr:DNA methyltransferase [Actinomycetota bacterium]
MRYYGCKAKLLDFLSEGVVKTGINHSSVFCDLFSGTTVVARHFKKKGYTVYANDFLEFSYSLARAYIKNNIYPHFSGLKNVIFGVNGHPVENLNLVIDYLNKLYPIKDFIFNNYCPGGTKELDYPRKYFTDENGMKIDSIRTRIQRWKDENIISEDEFYILLTSLIEAIPYVANISGNYAAYLKEWDPRALKPITLKAPIIFESKRKNNAFKEDANILIKKIGCDILYLDPPYNTRQYAPNYFLLELVAEGWFGDIKPKIYGKTGMRAYQNQKSVYSQKNTVMNAFENLIKNANTRFILLSYNDEGLMSENEILSVLLSRGKVQIFKRPYRRYRSINQNESDRRTVFETLYFVKV